MVNHLVVYTYYVANNVYANILCLKNLDVRKIGIERRNKSKM